jgi:hypothetical protein
MRTIDDAMAEYNRGVAVDWKELTRHLIFDDFPAVLAEVHVDLDQDQLARALRDAWTRTNPTSRATVDRTLWLKWFRALGYIEDDRMADPPRRLTLYRGAPDPNGMSWTSDINVAKYFRDSWRGRLWTTTVGHRRLLAHFPSSVRLDDSGLVESEYVIDPTGLRPREIR